MAVVSELFALESELAVWEGSRQIARDVGAAFAPVLPSIVPYLLQTARQDIEMVIDSVSHGRSGSTFIPGQNKVLHFNLEQFRDMKRTVESLAVYARATGRGFLPWAEGAVKRANYVSGIVGDYSADLCASAAELLAAIGMAVAPDSAGELAGCLLELASPEIEVEVVMISIVVAVPVIMSIVITVPFTIGIVIISIVVKAPAIISIAVTVPVVISIVITIRFTILIVVIFIIITVLFTIFIRIISTTSIVTNLRAPDRPVDRFHFNSADPRFGDADPDQPGRSLHGDVFRPPDYLSV
jgi:hypothetical protein